ncbi:MAG TPA: hypothetical protein VKV40_24525 [Ktedonobacteraceae bacterium]|nr:hypothetical protein [Ktedonobacteraceae bacterium]
MQDQSTQQYRLLTPEELVEIGFSRSRVVMMNEAHNGETRCIRTRQIGLRLLPTLHHLGVRHMAMEALAARTVEEINQTRLIAGARAGYYFSQPELRAFAQSALDLGWTLIAYEADFSQEPANLSERGRNNWREEMQARNILAALNALPPDARLFVWCGNSHHARAIVPVRAGEPDELWALMGYHFQQLSGIKHFVLDQTRTVRFLPRSRPQLEQWLNEHTAALTALGGTGGFLNEETPSCFRTSESEDAFLVSLYNEME